MKIFIPTPLRVYADNQDTVLVEAKTVGEALAQLTSQHPELKKHLYSEEGKLRSFVNIYLNEEDVRYLPEKDTTPVTDSDSLSIIPSIAGGTTRHRSGIAPCQRAYHCGNFRTEKSELWQPQF